MIRFREGRRGCAGGHYIFVFTRTKSRQPEQETDLHKKAPVACTGRLGSFRNNNKGGLNLLDANIICM